MAEDNAVVNKFFNIPLINEFIKETVYTNNPKVPSLLSSYIRLLNVSIEEVVNPKIDTESKTTQEKVKKIDGDSQIPATSEENLFACCVRIDDLMTLVNLSTKVYNSYSQS
jgi:hypothetical protein